MSSARLSVCGVPLRPVTVSSLRPLFLRPSQHLSQRRRSSPPRTTVRAAAAAGWLPSRASSLGLLATPPLCSKSLPAKDVGDVEDSISKPSQEEKNGEQTMRFFSYQEFLRWSRKYGVAGILSYGLLNTIYYLTTFLLVWFYFVPAPGRMGFAASVQRFFLVMGVVWAGSQVTKIIRLGGAVALTPFVARGLSWFTAKFKFDSEGKAFAVITGICFSVALFLFFGLTMLWA